MSPWQRQVVKVFETGLKMTLSWVNCYQLERATSLCLSMARLGICKMGLNLDGQDKLGVVS